MPWVFVCHRRRCVHEDEKGENVRAWDGGGILGACTRFAPILSRVAAGAEPAQLVFVAKIVPISPSTHSPMHPSVHVCAWRLNLGAYCAASAEHGRPTATSVLEANLQFVRPTYQIEYR
jgi:hypothetical protein